MTKKLSISITDELHDAIESISILYRTNVSRIVENYLREHPMVKREIELIRSEPKAGAIAASHRRPPKIDQEREAAQAASA